MGWSGFKSNNFFQSAFVHLYRMKDTEAEQQQKAGDEDDEGEIDIKAEIKNSKASYIQTSQHGNHYKRWVCVFSRWFHF